MEKRANYRESGMDLQGLENEPHVSKFQVHYYKLN